MATFTSVMKYPLSPASLKQQIDLNRYMPDLLSHWEILPLFFLIAALYASVGHGGASGYLAIFALFGIASSSIAPLVLLLNIIAASISFWNYYRGGYFSFRLLKPFALASIPAAFLGGMITVSSTLFALMLGVALLLAAIRILFLHEVKELKSAHFEKKVWTAGLPIGFVLGFISGMIGIGGGVFLSPILLFFRWADAKKTAAVSSAFIVLNSLSGLSGHITRGNFSFESSAILFAVVFIGALVGSRISVKRISARHLQVALGVVLVFASVKLLTKVLM